MTTLKATIKTEQKLKGTVNFVSAKQVDAQLSTTSENPVQNKVVTASILNLENAVSSMKPRILPIVTQENNGQVMQVVNGQWVLSGMFSSAAIGEVTLPASAWVGQSSPYSQVVQIAGVTENSQVDLTPSVEQLSIFHNKDLAFVTENDGGVVTVYAIGQKPMDDYVIQVTITEVAV